jgi:hypothetical protein
VPGSGWNGFSTLTAATALNWRIYADNGGVPDGNPAGGGNAPFWSISVPPADGQVTITTGFGGYPSNARINLATPVNLPPGTWWLVFFPTLDFATGGQYGTQPADTTNGATTQFINPGGGFGYGTEWQAWSVLGPTQQDMAFTIEGEQASPEITVTPQALNFGPVFVDESLVRTIEVSNTSEVYTATVTADIYPAPSTFTLSGCETTLITQTACTLSVTFTPPQMDVYTAYITVTAIFEGADVTYTFTPNITITGEGVYDATPSALEGTYGSQIQYGGALGGFGDKKGKVYINGVKQKVDSWVSAQIEIIVNKVKDLLVDTPYDVSIQWKPKGSKTTNIVDLPGAFTLRKPEIDPISTATGSAGDSITLNGMWFGTKKGKVYIGDQKCKVTAWTMNPTTGVSTLTFVVDDKIGAGKYFLEVENKIGRSVSFGFEVK